MNLARRQKYDKSEKYSGKKYTIKYDLSSLDLMCCYVISVNSNIKRSNLLNMKNLFDMIDMSIYINDNKKIERINFIKKGLEGRLDQGISNPELLIKYINGGIIENDVATPDDSILLGNNEVEWINKTISEALNYIFIQDEVDRMIDLGTRFKASDYSSKSQIVNEVESLVDDMKNKFRRNKSETSTEMVFSLRDGTFEDNIREVHNIVTHPGRILRTGMQGLNELLGGGFESTRTYIFLGLSGAGKSFTLLNLAYQLKKYNKDYKTKDPSKIPVIVILTMENTVVETVTRLFQIASSREVDFRNHTPEEIVHILRTEGELYLTDESPIDIIIKFKPDRSVDTSYLYTLTEDLEDEGYEVIALIQDHIKKIRSIDNIVDMRLELGAIVNEFKAFAQLKDVVVITDSHINREGARTIDDAKVKNEADLVRKLGRSTVGESFLMIDNSDGAYVIEKEFDQNGQLYMGFSKLKSRVKTNRDLIYQPFVPGNDIKFIEDIYLPIPVFKDTLRSQVESIQPFNNGINRYQTGLKQIELKNDEDDDNIFSSRPVSMKSLDDLINEPTVYEERIGSNYSTDNSFKPFVQKEVIPGLIFD